MVSVRKNSRTLSRSSADATNKNGCNSARGLCRHPLHTQHCHLSLQTSNVHSRSPHRWSAQKFVHTTPRLSLFASALMIRSPKKQRKCDASHTLTAFMWFLRRNVVEAMGFRRALTHRSHHADRVDSLDLMGKSMEGQQPSRVIRA